VSYNLITVLVISVLLIAVSFVEAQQAKKMPRLGFLSALTPAAVSDHLEAFRQRLRQLGWAEGHNVALEYRWAEGKYERLPDLSAELVRLPVQVIFANSGVAGLAAKRVTSNVPIVFEMLGDPVSSGLVSSLARPGGNVTGVSGLGPELSTKQLELLKDILPQLTRLAVLSNPSNLIAAATLRETEVAAKSLAVQIQSFEARGMDNIEAAFTGMRRQRSDALLVVADPMFANNRDRIRTLVEKYRMPAIYYESRWVPEGGLMSYSPSQLEQFRKAAALVDKVLRGAKPSDLPVEQPTKLELVINLKAAKQIGVTIPPNVLARADRVIK
jgi:putative tryptophan/tyrosine transport system substrate-binding protein